MLFDLFLLLLFGRVTALGPFNLGADTFLNDVGFAHCESLGEFGPFEVRILFEDKLQCITLAFFMQFELDVLKISKDSSVLLDNQATNVLVPDHRS